MESGGSNSLGGGKSIRAILGVLGFQTGSWVHELCQTFNLWLTEAFFYRS
jgi:hypothetical protein